MASRHLEGRRSFHPDKSSLIPLEATSPLPRHAAGIRRRQSTYFRYTVLLQKMSKMTFLRITVNRKSYYDDAGRDAEQEKIGRNIEVIAPVETEKSRENFHVNEKDFTTIYIRAIAHERIKSAAPEIQRLLVTEVNVKNRFHYDNTVEGERKI